MQLGIYEVEVDEEVFPLFLQGLLKVSQLEVHKYAMDFAALEAFEAAWFTLLNLVRYQLWSFFASPNHQQIGHFPDGFFQEDGLDLILARVFVHLLIDIPEGLEGVDGNFVDWAAHLLEGAEGVDLDRVHKNDGGEDKQNSDKATADDVDDWVYSGSLPIVEDEWIAVSLRKNLLDLHVVCERQLRQGHLRQISRVFQRTTIYIHFQEHNWGCHVEGG